MGLNPTQAQCNFSSEELHWVSHGVVGGKCQYFTLSSFKYHYIYNGELGKKFFSQINGATIGGLGSTSITDIFGAEFIDPIVQNGFMSNAGEVVKPENWGRYRDDTFDIEVGELSKIENVERFTKHINENVFKTKIRFEEKTSNFELEFLDVKVCLKDGYLMPRIYAKPTDAHRYLDPSSCHPRKVTRAILLSVGLRLRRNCSDKYENDRVFKGIRTITPRTITPRTITPGQIPPGQLPPRTNTLRTFTPLRNFSSTYLGILCTYILHILCKSRPDHNIPHGRGSKSH